MWELDYKESLALKNWCFWAVVLEKTLESPLDCKEMKPVNPKGNQSWMFIGMTDVESETPILWPPDVKSWLIWKDPDAGKDWGQEEKGTTNDEMVGLFLPLGLDWLFSWDPKSLQMATAAMKLKDAHPLEGKLWPTEIAYLKAETLLCRLRSV